MRITLLDESYVEPPTPNPPVQIDQPGKYTPPAKGKNNVGIIVIAVVIVIIVVATILYFYGKKKQTN